MAISMEEILKGINVNSLPKEHQDNLKILLEKINKIRQLWGKPMTITSGYRSKEDQIRIYKDLAKQRNQVFDENKIPWGSAHLKCAAVDVSDTDGSLFKWCKDNEKTILQEVDVYCEEKDDQKRVHFQIYKFGSYKPGGTRFFKP